MGKECRYNYGQPGGGGGGSTPGGGGGGPGMSKRNETSAVYVCASCMSVAASHCRLQEDLPNPAVAYLPAAVARLLRAKQRKERKTIASTHLGIFLQQCAPMHHSTLTPVMIELPLVITE